MSRGAVTLRQNSKKAAYAPAVGWRGLKLIQEALSGVDTAQFTLHLLRKAIWERKCQENRQDEGNCKTRERSKGFIRRRSPWTTETKEENQMRVHRN